MEVIISKYLGFCFGVKDAIDLVEKCIKKYSDKKIYTFGEIIHNKSMINNFRKTFGNPDKVLVCVGDWDQKQHLKYKEPTKGKGLRKIFTKAGYNLFLVDEFNTSCKCCFNGDDMEKFRRRNNPRPWKKDIMLYHGLLRSKNVLNNKSDKHYILNRDFNGAMNIRYKAICHLENKKLPDYLSRKQH